MKLSKRLNTIEESATLALNTKAKELAASGRKIYNFTAGEPSTDTPGYIRDYVAGKLDQNHYTPVPGMPELRAAIAGHGKEFYSADWIKPENVLIVAGGKPGLYLSLLSILNPGDEVILPTPAWVSYKYIIELAGGTVVKARLADDFDLDVANIEAAITDKTKAIIINSPNNPTGSIYSPDSLQKLSGLLAGTDEAVLADYMYTNLVYDESFEPVTKFDFKNLIISSGFSKSQALTGWRIGYVVADAELVKAMTKLQSHLLGNVSNLSQYAAIAGLEHNDEPPMYDELKSNRDIVVESLNNTDKINFARPGGAFYAFIDIRDITENSLQWCDKLLDEKGVALVPGEAFFAPGYVRLSFTTDRKTLEEGLEKIKEFIGEKA
jgi:aspartate aminotransferase